MNIDINYFNELRDKAYDNAVKHGWHDKEYKDSHWLIMVITEIVEAIQAERHDKYAKLDEYEDFSMYSIIEYHEDKSNELYMKYIHDTLEDEIADIIIRMLDLAGLRNIDLKDCSIFWNEICTKDYRPIKGYKYFIEITFNLIRKISDFSKTEMKIRATICTLLMFCNYNGIDILAHVDIKMKYNETREYKHGNLKY